MSVFVAVRVEFLRHRLAQSILGAELRDGHVETGVTVGLKESQAFQVVQLNREIGRGRWDENVLLWGSRHSWIMSGSRRSSIAPEQVNNVCSDREVEDRSGGRWLILGVESVLENQRQSSWLNVKEVMVGWHVQ